MEPRVYDTMSEDDSVIGDTCDLEWLIVPIWEWSMSILMVNNTNTFTVSMTWYGCLLIF